LDSPYNLCICTGKAVPLRTVRLFDERGIVHYKRVLMHDFRAEPKSNWEKTIIAFPYKRKIPMSSPRLCILATLFVFVVILFGARFFRSFVATRFNQCFHDVSSTYHDVLGRDPDMKELKKSFSGLLDGSFTARSLRHALTNSPEGTIRSALLKKYGIKYSPNINTAISFASHRCACGDFYDEQLQRCFMMDPSIVLWVGGYGLAQEGSFVSQLAVRLKGRVSPSTMYMNAGCTAHPGSLSSLSIYSYPSTAAAQIHSVYLTCKILPPDIMQCLLSVEQVLASGQTVFLENRIPISDSFGDERIRMCAQKDWCIKSITPQRISSSISKMNTASISQTPILGTTHTKVQSTILIKFLSWKSSLYESHNEDFAIDKQAGCDHQTNHPEEVGGWNETMLHFRYLWRCRIHFALARFGDGELAVMSGRGYESQTDIGNWTFQPVSTDTGYLKLAQFMLDGFTLAREHSNAEIIGGMYLGLPFHFCGEGIHDHTKGGGGHDDWLMDYLTRFGRILQNVDSNRFVYSWQWGHFNYPASMELIQEMGARDGGLILICNEDVIKNKENLPSWVKLVLMVPGSGVEWFASHANRIEIQAAKIALANHNQVFIFSAGPVSNALIPLMWRTNPNNSYIDFGGTLDYSVHGIKTRPFHPDPALDTRPWLRADGSLHREQNCHQTRWSVFYEPRVVPLDFVR